MSLRPQIESIQGFKTWLDGRYQRPAQVPASDYFRQLLLRPNTRAAIQQHVIPHLATPWTRNYFFCALLSLHFQKENHYDLGLWETFVNTTRPELGGFFPTLNSIDESAVLESLAIHSVNQVWNLPQNCIWALRVNSSSVPTRLLNDFREDQFDQPVADRILNRIKVVMKKRGTGGEQVWGDNDIIVVASPNGDPQNADVFCIISCKTSLRERVYQSVFWSMHSRLEGVGKHTFLTLDKGNSGTSEIGSELESRKSRTVIESTFDRVYVFRNAGEVPRSYVIKDFDYLRADLIRWRDDYFGL